MKRDVSILLAIVSALTAAIGFAQTAAAPAAAFPDALLQGRPVFDLAIFYQGDLRGNFGPCG